MWNRHGDFEARIERIDFFNERGEPSAVFHTGERVTVDVHWVADRPLNYASFAFSILDDNDRDVFTTATHFSYIDVEWLEGRGIARFVIESLDVLEGFYSVQAGIAERVEGPGSAVDFYQGRDFVKAMEPFMVRPRKEDRGRSGVANLPCRCEIVSGSERYAPASG